jgi:hypothetical protein
VGQTVEAPKKTLVMAGKLQARTGRTPAQSPSPASAEKPAAITLPDTPVAKRVDAKEKILRALKRLHPME